MTVSYNFMKWTWCWGYSRRSCFARTSLALVNSWARLSFTHFKRRSFLTLKRLTGVPWDPSHGFFRVTLRIFIIFTNTFMNLSLTYLLMFSIN